MKSMQRRVFHFMSELHFAVASTFSPRFASVIAEADFIAKKFGARLSVLHAGERSDEKLTKFHEAFEGLGREEVDVYWCEGETPARALVEAASSEYFDLLIVGTIRQPSETRHFTSEIVRELLENAPCDLLLLPDPKTAFSLEQHLCLLLDAHEPRWEAARAALIALKPAHLSVLAAENPFVQAREAALGMTSEIDPIEGACAGLSDLFSEVDLRRVHSNTGYALCDIVENAAPDFILVQTEWRDGRRFLPPHLDWLRQVIPARLLLVGRRQPSQSLH